MDKTPQCIFMLDGANFYREMTNLNYQIKVALLAGTLAATAIQAEEAEHLSKEVTGVAGLVPEQDLYSLKTFDNNFILPVYQTQSVNQAYYAPPKSK